MSKEASKPDRVQNPVEKPTRGGGGPQGSQKPTGSPGKAREPSKRCGSSASAEDGVTGEFPGGTRMTRDAAGHEPSGTPRLHDLSTAKTGTGWTERDRRVRFSPYRRESLESWTKLG